MGIESDTATVADTGSPSVPWSEPLRRLNLKLARLRRLAEQLKAAPPPDNSQWYQLLQNKLVPQVHGEPWLVVAVVGGTNIGKSVVFNHLVGENASAVSPRAAGTKHPVCLVPEHFADQERLAELFASFELRPWHAAEDSLQENSDHLLLWRLGRNVPPRLLLLDTPDIDSTAEVNWERADHVRQAADVLLAVLTMQKYNDAAVKRFFQHAAEADKSVVVVFNQVDLEGDREFWPDWLETFRKSTGVDPQLVYVVPYDRQAAERGELPFYDVGTDGRTPPGKPASLRTELAALHFSEIKLRTLGGALSVVLDEYQGAPAWLRSLDLAAGRFRKAYEVLLGGQELDKDWPQPDARLIRERFFEWWDQQRGPFTRTVHMTYRKIGQGARWIVNKVRGKDDETEEELIKRFQQKERAAIIRLFQQVFDRLEELDKLDDPVLSPRLKTILGGQQRVELRARLEKAYDEKTRDVADVFHEELNKHFEKWKEENPKTFRSLQYTDVTAAAFRPAITMTLAFVGGGAGVDIVANQAIDAALTVGVGEAATGAAGTAVVKAISKAFQAYATEFTEQRAQWFADWLRDNLFGELLSELQQGAQITSTPEYNEVQQALGDLRNQLKKLTAA